MTYLEFINLLLDNACGMYSDEYVKKNNGYQSYYIELHCRSYEVEAKKVAALDSNGFWEIKSCTKVIAEKEFNVG